MGLPKSRVAILSLVLAGTLTLAVGAWNLAVWLRPAPETLAPPSVATVTIGGPFALTDQEGRAVTDADFRGRLMLVFFGFTYCPDVCPTALTLVSDALDQLGKRAREVAPIFITIDPERDTPEQLKSYVAHFHPSMVALTGGADEIAKVAKAYRVYFARAPIEGGAADEYLMDHTSILYVMDREGKFAAHFTHGTAPEKIAARLKELL